MMYFMTKTYKHTVSYVTKLGHSTCSHIPRYENRVRLISTHTHTHISIYIYHIQH